MTKKKVIADETTTEQVLTSDEFLQWLIDARPGESKVYARGLTIESSVQRTTWKAYEQGAVSLHKRRIGKTPIGDEIGSFEYIAIKRRKNRQAKVPT